MSGRRPAVLVCGGVALAGWALCWAVFHAAPGQDWVVFHTASSRVWAGDATGLYDPVAFTALLNRTHAAWFAQPLLFHPFVYPPVTLLLALAFGWPGYLASLCGFLAATGLALVAALRLWARGRRLGWLVVGVLACPAAAFNIGAGQLGFGVAACAVAGVYWLERRKLLAGLVLSLLCLKPHFALLIPVALLAGRHWRAMAGGALGGAGLVLASLAVAGPAAWLAWLSLVAGGDPRLAGLILALRDYDQSVHRCLVFLGAGEGLAGAGQVLALAVAALCVWLAFARPLAPVRRLVVLLCAMVFGAPHVGDYDHVLTAVAACLCLLEGRCVWLAALVWMAPACNPPALVAVLGVRALVWASACLVVLPGLLMVLQMRSGKFEAKRSLLF